ncbi:hypothetical protein DV738_g5317, partial [Chaetothyriales sp. CBS 135597]
MASKRSLTTAGLGLCSSCRRVARPQFALPSLLQTRQATTTPSIHSIYASPSAHPYHIHVYAHRHNTHITFTSPAFNPILSFSCGSIGLRKAQRSSFDAAFNLSTFFFRRLAAAQWRDGGKKMGSRAPLKTLRDIQTRSEGEGVEVILRGFGPGREAFQKALLGQDGALVRGLVWKVTDATRLKFGGVRSPAVRRLG